MPEQMALVPRDTTEDAMVELWLADKESDHTKRSYRRYINQFRSFIGKPILEANLFDLQEYKKNLTGRHLGDNSQKLIMNVVKSYLTFASKAFLLPVNIGAAVKAPHEKETISERILTEYEVQSMILGEKDSRNHAILRILYDGGVRVSELCNLRWKNAIDRGEGSLQLSILGKRKKQRQVLLGQETSAALLALGRGQDEDYVFRNEAYHTRKLTTRSVQYIVKEAARRAGVHDWKHVSPHWMRHSHASHALNRNAPLALVRDTLGHSSIAITNLYTHARPGESSSRYLPKF